MNVRIHVEVYTHFDDEVCSIVFYTVKHKSPHKNCCINPKAPTTTKNDFTSPSEKTRGMFGKHMLMYLNDLLDYFPVREFSMLRN